MRTLRNFLNEVDGLTAVEYGLVTAIIVFAAVAVLRPMSERVLTALEDANVGLTMLESVRDD